MITVVPFSKSCLWGWNEPIHLKPIKLSLPCKNSQILAIIIHIIVVTIVMAVSTHDFLTMVPGFISVLHSMGDMETRACVKYCSNLKWLSVKAECTYSEVFKSQITKRAVAWEYKTHSVMALKIPKVIIPSLYCIEKRPLSVASC